MNISPSTNYSTQNNGGLDRNQDLIKRLSALQSQGSEMAIHKENNKTIVSNMKTG